MPKGRSTAAKLVPCPGLSVGGDAKYFGVVSNDENFSVSPHTPISCGDGSAPLSQTRGVAFGNSERESSDEWPAVRSSLSEPACSPLFSRAQCAGGFLAGKDKQPRRRVGNGTKIPFTKTKRQNRKWERGLVNHLPSSIVFWSRSSFPPPFLGSSQRSSFLPCPSVAARGGVGYRTRGRNTTTAPGGGAAAVLALQPPDTRRLIIGVQ